MKPPLRYEMDAGTRARLDALLGDDVDRWLEIARRLPEEPAEGSPWFRDGAALDVYSGWYLAWGALSVGVAYLDTLRELLKGGVMHPHPSLGLLRGALEASGTALWLSEPDEDVTRQQRAVRAWYADLEDRASYERFTGWQPSRARGKHATTRQVEVRQLCTPLGLSTSKNGLRRNTGEWLREAGAAIGVPKADVQRLWSLSSGLAHGRYWPVFLGLDAVGSTRAPQGTVALVLTVPDDVLTDMAGLAHRFTVSALHHVREKGISSRPESPPSD